MVAIWSSRADPCPEGPPAAGIADHTTTLLQCHAIDLLGLGTHDHTGLKRGEKAAFWKARPAAHGEPQNQSIPECFGKVGMEETLQDIFSVSFPPTT